MTTRNLRRFLRNVKRDILKIIVGIVPKKNNLILFSAWFGKKYADNTKFLFEYMRDNSSYEVEWFTKEKVLYDELKSRGVPVVYSRTLKGVWHQCRAKMLVSTVQTSDFNMLLLNNCIYLDLGHGFPGKPTGLMQPTVNKDWVDWFQYTKKGLRYYETAASYFTVEYTGPCYDVQPDHFVFSNKPRIDILFDETLRKDINKNIDKIKGTKRLITYLPTHRSCGKKEMDISKIFDLNTLQLFCEQTDSVFVIKKHFYHNAEQTDLIHFPNIFDVTNEDVDTEVLLAQSDILVTDFSSCFIDFLALERPIVFYAYDYDDYMANERDYYWKYDMINGGYTAKTYREFLLTLYDLSKDWSDSKHKDGRLEMRRFYFDDEVEMGTSREKLSRIIDQLIKGTYKPFDWSSRKKTAILS